MRKEAVAAELVKIAKSLISSMPSKWVRSDRDGYKEFGVTIPVGGGVPKTSDFVRKIQTAEKNAVSEVLSIASKYKIKIDPTDKSSRFYSYGRDDLRVEFSVACDSLSDEQYQSLKQEGFVWVD